MCYYIIASFFQVLTAILVVLVPVIIRSEALIKNCTHGLF